MANERQPRYWVFKHKPGENASEDDCREFVTQAVTYNYAFMQYEYDYQDHRKVTQNWRLISKIKAGDYVFLRGGNYIYAFGQAIKPRQKMDVKLTIEKIINNRSHGDFVSGKYHGVVHFTDADVFYESLSEEENNWGQRIDVDSWKYFNPNGIWATSKDFYVFGQNDYGVIKELKPNKGKEIIKQLKGYLGMKSNLVDLLISNHNLILNGAPGTGKTYLAKQIARLMMFGKSEEKELSDSEITEFNNRCCTIQFHPSYDYTDFVEGLRPYGKGNIGFERTNGVFKDFCKKAYLIKEKIIKTIENEELTTRKEERKFKIVKVNDNSITIKPYSTGNEREIDLTSINAYIKEKKITDDKNTSYIPVIGDYIIEKLGEQKFVFIIDEINRGEISKIFGELFFSIDPGYRGEKGKVKTQYQNLVEEDNEFYDGFFVPENVYIIGTMNDIDRSVESMDFAFRRRFAFYEIKAKDTQAMLDDLDWKDEAVKRMDRLNDEISKVEGLSSAYHIGASYFLKLKNYNGDFKKLWDYHIEGLLREYLRGVQDVEGNILKLKEAYDNESDSNNGQQQ